MLFFLWSFSKAVSSRLAVLTTEQGKGDRCTVPHIVLCLSFLWYPTNQCKSSRPDCTHNLPSHGRSLQGAADAFLQHPFCCSLTPSCDTGTGLVT